ncbi:MAG: glutamine--fructose-6-phosphate transaminase (isomerizing) [Chloroflexi bacterium]|nr:glutamine--fructose-6-phosphate transaminase (isomerizing) [Chloroflexota bacterium]
MCGIFGYVGPERAVGPLVLAGLRKLEYRGYDSWGVAVRQNGHLAHDKQVGKIGTAEVDLPDGTAGFGHTRWATHGAVTRANAHPHFDSTGRLALIHNGIVENYAELRDRLLALGHRFRSETDSEVIVHLIEEELKHPEHGGDLTGATRAAFRQLHGLNAIIVMPAGQDRLVAAKNVSPLVIGLAPDAVYIASDVTALLEHTRQVIYLEDGQIATLSAGGIEIRDVATGVFVEPRIERITWEVGDIGLNGYPHYMAKEIAEQPRIVATLVETHVAAALALADDIRAAGATHLIGCGTASYAALSGKYLLSRIAARPVNVASGSEFKYLEHALDERSLIVALSQSGETADLIEAVLLARQRGARIAALVNMPGSTLMRMADHAIPLQCGPEQCVLSTKAYIAKLAVLVLTAHALAGTVETGQALLRQAVLAMQDVLNGEAARRVRELARLIRDKEHLYIVGRGLAYPTALESALKVKEVSYIHAEGFAAGELKHGVIALIEHGTPCIVFAPDDDTRDDVLAGAMEMRARGGFIVGVATTPSDAFDLHIPVANVGDAQPLVNVIPAQMLGYHLALLRNYDPDKPRNLAKSVTVK